MITNSNILLSLFVGLEINLIFIQENMFPNLITYMKIKQKYNNTINGDLRAIQYMLVHIGIIYYIIQFESFCCPP